MLRDDIRCTSPLFYQLYIQYDNDNDTNDDDSQSSSSTSIRPIPIRLLNMDMDTNDYDDDDDVSLVHRYHLCDATNKDGILRIAALTRLVITPQPLFEIYMMDINTHEYTDDNTTPSSISSINMLIAFSSLYYNESSKYWILIIAIFIPWTIITILISIYRMYIIIRRYPTTTSSSIQIGRRPTSESSCVFTPKSLVLLHKFATCILISHTLFLILVLLLFCIIIISSNTFIPPPPWSNYYHLCDSYIIYLLVLSIIVIIIDVISVSRVFTFLLDREQGNHHLQEHKNEQDGIVDQQSDYMSKTTYNNTYIQHNSPPTSHPTNTTIVLNNRTQSTKPPHHGLLPPSLIGGYTDDDNNRSGSRNSPGRRNKKDTGES